MQDEGNVGQLGRISLLRTVTFEHVHYIFSDMRYLKLILSTY